MILLLGGGGFIGRNVQRVLRRKRLDYYVIERDTIFFVGFQTGRREPNKRLIEGCFIDNISALVPEVIVDFVSSTPVAYNACHPHQIKAQVCGIRDRLLNAISKKSLRAYVYISSGGVIYDPALTRPLREDDDLFPNSNYARSKIILEKYIKKIADEFALEYVVLRPSNPYGYFQKIGIGQGVVAEWINKIRLGEKVQIFGGLDNTRDYIFVSDLAEIIVNFVLARSLPCETFNVGTNSGTTLEALLEKISDMLGIRAKLCFAGSSLLPITYNVLCNEKLLSYNPSIEFTSLDLGLRKYDRAARRTMNFGQK